VALINAGALRINQDLPAYSILGRRVVEELVQYENELVLVEISGERLQKILDHAVRGWPSGHFLQVSGIAFRHDPVAAKASDLHLLTQEAGPVLLEPDAVVKVALPRFLVDPKKGDQDGYGEEANGGLSMMDVKASGSSMREALIEALKAAGKDGIAPEREGRICRTDLPTRPCLLSE
jgi:2',3'-cyclic-nucleotide 2'-phosphodiesterase (5'-nucleotidase family)